MPKDLPQRKSIRLRQYDYSQAGYYFITICVDSRHNLLSNIVGEGFPLPQIKITPYGEIVEKYLLELPLKYPTIKIDKYVIMPNHIHLILVLDAINGREDPAPTVGQIMGYFKFQTTQSINRLRNDEISKFWQKSYHDHIIRNDMEYKEIWQYIDTNPLKWKDDCYYI